MIAKNLYVCIRALIVVIVVGGLSPSSGADSAVTDLSAIRPLAVDKYTVGLWKFDNVISNQAPDISGKCPPAVLNTNTTIKVLHAELPGFSNGVQLLRNGTIMFPGVTPLLAGKSNTPFTVEYRLRLCNGLFATSVGHLYWSFDAYRDAGTAYSHFNMTTPDGKNPRIRMDISGVNERIDPTFTERFRHYALVWDGGKTLRMFVDGNLVAEQVAPGATGPVQFEAPDAILYDSSLAILTEARFSNVARTFIPLRRYYPSDLKAALQQGWIGFDMGTADSPVEEGFLRVTTNTLYAVQTGYGWEQPPLSAHDAWFGAGWYPYDLDEVIKNKQRHARSWLSRDGVLVPSGNRFHVDLPPGQYAVAVTVGHQRTNTCTKLIMANGVTIGADLNTFVDRMSDLNDRTARGIVSVTSNGLSVAVFTPAPQPASVLGIEIRPWKPLPMALVKGRLEWTGKGTPPDGFREAADAIYTEPFQTTAQKAEFIQDPVVRCGVWAYLVGLPGTPHPWDLVLTERIMDTLRDTCQAHPSDIVAASLLDATIRFYPALLSVVGGRRHDLLIGHTIRVEKEGYDQAVQMTPADPYYGRAMHLAGQSRYWDEQTRSFFGADPAYPLSTNFFAKVLTAYPSNRLARIYLGEQVPAAKPVPVPPHTPEWAVLQHRLLVRMTDVHEYWIGQQDPSTGLMGGNGGFGDDIEMTRNWRSAVLVADDEIVKTGWRRLADAGWKMHPKGYPAEIGDVEHSAEEMSDSQTVSVLMEFGASRHKDIMERVNKLWPLFRDLWTATNPQGFRMFKSTYFGADGISDTPENAGDSAYSIRAMSGAFWSTYFTREPETSQLLLSYADSWRDATMQSRSGKPAGICPVYISFKTRDFGTNPGQWWTGVIGIPYPVPAWDVYGLLIAGYDLSGNDKYLDSIRAGLKLLRDNPPPAGDLSKLPPGSLLWALYTPLVPGCTGAAFIGGLGGSCYRAFSGNNDFDDVLSRFGSGQIQTCIRYEKATKDSERVAAMKPIETELNQALDVMDYNIEIRTTEPLATDRVTVKGDDTLLSMATGSAANRFQCAWPLYAVTWQKTGTDVAMCLLETKPARISGYLYNFSKQAKTIGARFWRLQPGAYTLSLLPVDSMTPQTSAPALFTKTFKINKRGDSVDLTLPAQQQVWMTVRTADGP